MTASVGWHAGLGGGSFGPQNAFEALDPHRDRFALADLDADGDLDFVMYTTRSWLQLYWNDGAGGFTNETHYVPYMGGTIPSPHRVWSADVDDDGLAGVLITPSQVETNGVRILRRLPDNSGWQTPFTQILLEHDGTSGILLDAALRDVDGDGDTDFVTDRLTRNATHTLPESGRRWQVGPGSPGTGGLVPTLGADGPFRVGESAELLIRGGVGGASGLLTITLVRGGERGPSGTGWIAPTSERFLTQIPFTLSGAPGAAGTGSWSRPFTVGPAFAHDKRRYVAEIYDAGAPNGVARTNALLVTYGPYQP